MSSGRQAQLDTAVETVYAHFTEDQPHNYYIGWHQFEQIIEEDTDIDDDDAHDVWTLFNDRYVRQRPTKNGDLLNTDAIERAEELGVDTKTSEEVQDEIIEYLHEEYLNNPNDPVSREDLLDELDLDEDVLDINTYVLRLRNWVEINTQVGIGNSGYNSLELTTAARRQLS